MANELKVLEDFSFLSLLEEGYPAEVAGAATRLKAIKQVINDSEARTANAALKDAKTVYNVVHGKSNGKRIEVTRILKQVTDRVNEAAATATAMLDKPMADVKAMLDNYAAEQLRKQREEQERAAAEAAREAAEAQAKADEEAKMASMFGADGAAPSAPEEPEVVEPEVVEPEKKKPVVQGVTVRTSWQLEVVNPNLVPREFCSPDEKKIREWMTNQKQNGLTVDMLHIDGVVFTEKVSV